MLVLMFGWEIAEGITGTENIRMFCFDQDEFWAFRQTESLKSICFAYPYIFI